VTRVFGVLGTGMPFQFPGNPPGFVRRERAMPRRAVRIQLIGRPANPRGLREPLVYQPRQQVGAILRRSPHSQAFSQLAGG